MVSKNLPLHPIYQLRWYPIAHLVNNYLLIKNPFVGKFWMLVVTISVRATQFYFEENRQIICIFKLKTQDMFHFLTSLNKTRYTHRQNEFKPEPISFRSKRYVILARCAHHILFLPKAKSWHCIILSDPLDIWPGDHLHVHDTKIVPKKLNSCYFKIPPYTVTAWTSLVARTQTQRLYSHSDNYVKVRARGSLILQ
jgi:hypothetical protein